jgi:hypothetical protein
MHINDYSFICCQKECECKYTVQPLVEGHIPQIIFMSGTKQTRVLIVLWSPLMPICFKKRECGLATCPLRLFSPTIFLPHTIFLFWQIEFDFFTCWSKALFQKHLFFSVHTHPFISFLEGCFSKHPHVHQGSDELFLLPHTPLILENRIRFFHVLIKGSFSKSFVS